MDAQSDIPPEQGEELPQELLTVREMAKRLHVHPNTLRQWSDSGLIRSYRIGVRGDRRFSAADVNTVITTAEPKPRGSVLIVDDDPAVRQLLEHAVGEQGCKVTAVESGETALEELKKQHFDLVFLDLVLPGLSGLEVLRSIKANNKATVVAVITGYGEDPIALEAMSMGPMFFIRKPFDIADITEALNATIGVGR